LSVGPGIAGAQNAASKTAADALFDEGRRLITKGDVAAACEKFEASLERFAQLGTQIALASCYEKQGRYASAVGAFRAAASAAAKAHDRRQRFAEEHIALLEPKLPKLAIVVISNRPEGLEVRRDGVEIRPAEFGVPVPVDPGEHTVEASAPQRKPWSIRISIPATPGVVDVPIPALEEDVARPPNPPPTLPQPAAPLPDAPAAPHRPDNLLAYSIGGGGVAMVGVSLIFGALAKSKWGDAQMHCHGSLCDPTGVDLAGSAQTMGNLSTATFLIGLAAVGAGGFLLFNARKDHEAAPAVGNTTALRVVPTVGSSELGLSLQGGF
jgi:hypothetical protein